MVTKVTDEKLNSSDDVTTTKAPVKKTVLKGTKPKTPKATTKAKTIRVPKPEPKTTTRKNAATGTKGKAASDLKGKIKENFTSTAPMVAEIERLIIWSMNDLSQLGEAEDMDLTKFKCLITMEAPHNSAGTHKKDRITLGHFTLTDQWKDADGTTYRAININPFLLSHMDGNALLRTCYHEAIHAFNSYRDVKDTATNGRHNKKFQAACELTGILDCEKVNDYRGYATPSFTKQGLKTIKTAKAKAPTHFKILPEEKEKKVGQKRVTLECPQCGMKAGVPVGVFTANLDKVKQNASVELWSAVHPEQVLSIMECIADGTGMMPPENFIL